MLIVYIIGNLIHKLSNVLNHEQYHYWIQYGYPLRTTLCTF